MKVFAKPISSSPKRPPPPEPPLITTFPRTKSKRGSRSRANPMFVTKLNDANLEPSSPKVTCIGQVKIKRRRSNNHHKQATTTSGSTAFRRRCRRWIRKLKPERFRRVWRRTLSFLRCDYGGKSRKLQESERRRSLSFLRCDNGGKSRKLQESERRRCLSFLRCDYGGKSKKLQELERIEANNSNQKKNEINLKREIEDVIIVPDNSNNDDDDNVLITESPPRNAFLLTRSRSAPPYRSSSFPSRNGDETGKKLAENNGIEDETEVISGECEGSINGVEEVIKGRKRLSLLSRCKSIPGRTGDERFSSFGSEIERD